MTTSFVTDLIKFIKTQEKKVSRLYIYSKNEKLAISAANFIRNIAKAERIAVGQVFGETALGSPYENSLLIIDNGYGYDYRNPDFRFGQWFGRLSEKFSEDTEVVIFTKPKNW